ncbi:MAG: hypothetical protein ACTSSH_02395 [Candidatus Heimdallarchaeota archaeon]
MEHSLSFWFALGQGGIVTLASFIFSAVMFSNFFKKKTTGTALLAFLYLTMFISQLTALLFNVYSYINPLETVHRVSFIVYMLFTLLSFVVLYNFASRHILKDNDIVKLMYTVISIGAIFGMVGIIAYEIFAKVADPIFYNINIQAGTGFLHYLPTTLVTAIVYGLIVVFIQLRIIITMTVTYVRKKQKDPIKRKGFLYILLSVTFLSLTILLTTMFIFEGLPDYVIILIYVTRAIAYILSIFFSYIGWILPNWFRKRIRQKAWIVKQLKTTKEPTTRFVTSTTYFEETKLTKQVDV